VRRSGPFLSGDEKAQYISKLLWMTESHVVLFDSVTNVVEEIPRSHISSIVYIPIPDWGLPERVLDRQPKYIRIDTETSPLRAER
jgi:hypothetical protein